LAERVMSEADRTAKLMKQLEKSTGIQMETEIPPFPRGDEVPSDPVDEQLAEALSLLVEILKSKVRGF